MILPPGLLLLLLLLLLLSSSLSVLRGEPVGGQGARRSLAFGDAIHRVAAANDTVYVAAGDRLYQLSHDLTLVHNVSLAGARNGDQFRRVPDGAPGNATLTVDVLLPFVENGTVLVCGGTGGDGAHCEVLNLTDITQLLYSESISLGPLRRGTASVVFHVTVANTQTGSDAYILSAIEASQSSQEPCAEVVHLQNTASHQTGGIFSFSDGIDGTPSIKSAHRVEFVDGFQVGPSIYLLTNVRQGDGGNGVRVLWLEAKGTKTQTLRSLRNASLEVSVDGKKLLASSLVPGASSVLWSGVFSAGPGATGTVLAVFDISPDLPATANDESDKGCTSTQFTSKRNPKAVFSRQDNMTSVLAVKQNAWVVFFIGTGDGQLLKLSMDKNYRTCGSVLFRPSDDGRVFPKILLDEADRQHIYVSLKKEIMRVPISKCSTRANVHDCWEARDPFCVWCGSGGSCTFKDSCPDSDWLSIPDDFRDKMVSYTVAKDSNGQITLHINAHLTVGQKALSSFACEFQGLLGPSGTVCATAVPQFPQCTCRLASSALPAEGLPVHVKITLGKTQLLEHLTLTNCSDIRGAPSPVLCQRCIGAGCGWIENECSWAIEGVTNDSVCQTMTSDVNLSRPEISSVSPSVVSFYGRNNALLSGHSLGNVTKVRLLGQTDCTQRESPVWNNTGVSLTFHIPRADSGDSVELCAVLSDGSCHGGAKITYHSSPLCTNVVPSSTWASGKRRVTLMGSRLDLVDGVTHSNTSHDVIQLKSSSYKNLTYDTPAAESSQGSSNVFLRVANETLPCTISVTYYPEPEFIRFRHIRAGDDVRITIEKKTDKLEMTTAELSVWGVQGDDRYPCVVKDKKSQNESDVFTCEIQNAPNSEFQQLIIMYGDKTVPLHLKRSLLLLWMLMVILLIPCIIVVVVIVYRRKQRQFTSEINKMIEDVELDLRNDIRQGFVDLQTEKTDLMENVGAVPFLDYKHFAARIFFPQNESLMALCITDISQDTVKVKVDECCRGVSELIREPLFLTSMVHAVEEQKSFGMDDKCALASLLTVALHSDLTYLTETMEVLLKHLMQQKSNTQPKLMLRRTESTVEKLLTNWMSICLYGFLRESVGQQLFLMVSALTQQIHKGPVDCVTEKALYTLSEDWLLWQAQDFSSLSLKVLFAVGTDGEVSEPLDVKSLTCDTVEQVKEKILSAFKAKFGFPYNTPLREVRIEFEKDGSFLPLEEVDKSSEVVGEVTMLNTLKHYKVPDGATIKVLSKRIHPPLGPQGSVRDDNNFSGKYFHLIDPDVDEDQRKNPEKMKLKVKEVHLTKLLSTKMAVHSFVENLFRSIWGIPAGRPPHAVKYFFDFLDAQAEDMKITDPDVLHIWKTNSLPLRFWVNILKNPQFVFDMEKSPQLESCLSVIAQAFMDSFSLSENQLGKHAPTNKLLYGKDIPKFQQEVKEYYKHIRDQAAITHAEFKIFLQTESKKHENEFNEAAALRELYKFIERYFTEIKEKLEHNGAPAELTERLGSVKERFDGLKSCSWS